ncbi:hypothetical protein BGX28_006758 [Mortierella sp. GBA30]|nr:hypothetical protein BGX28_006758 [Mortierella sp. GBA30]
MANAVIHDDGTDTETVYQSFRSPKDARPIKIPAVQHPTTGEHYVIWSDITDCFPGVLRVQHGDLFVPFLRNQNLYRVKPHGIRYHPEVVLEIVYSNTIQQECRQQHKKIRSSRHGISPSRSDATVRRRLSKLSMTETFSESEHEGQGPSSSGSYVISSPQRTELFPDHIRGDSEALDYAEHQEDEADEWHTDELEHAGEEDSESEHHQDNELDKENDESDDQLSDRQEEGLKSANGQQDLEESDADVEEAVEDKVLGEVGTVITKAAPDDVKHGGFEGLDDLDPNFLEFRPEDIPESIQLIKRTLETKAADIAQHRIESVLRKRYRWIESICPKLFIILPTKDYIPPKGSKIADNCRSLTWAHFRVHFCCDRGGMDCDMRYGQQGYAIKVEKEEDMVNQYGQYIMGVLETLKYGVTCNGAVAPPDPDPMMQKRLSLAIQFLESKSVSSSEMLLYIGEEMAQIHPLDKHQLRDFIKFLVVEHGSEPHGEMNPCPSAERDIQWVCQAHWITMSGSEEVNAVQQFVKDAAGSVACEFQASRAARVVIKSRERARDFYRMADKLKTVCAFRLVLDWDFTPKDEEELCQALSRFQAPVVKIIVRPSPTQKVCIQGLAHGYSSVITMALQNERIEAFMMGLSKEDRRGPAGHDERKDLKKGFPMLRQDLVRFKRNTRTGKINISIAVINFDMAMITVRMAVKGLHNLSKFNMYVVEISDSICMKFIKPGQPGSEIEDTGYRTDNPTGFFKKRRGQDTIKYSCFRAASTLLHSTALVEVHISFVYARDRNTVRDILRQNRRLQKLELFNTADDDPSQVYETFKALMANHPTLESLEITQRQGRPMTSSFKWEHVSDPAKMEVSMNFCETDRVVSMFQRYATSLSRIQILSITPHDAAVLEKALRPKKGPFKLQHFMMTGAAEIEAAALEDLKKIILRADVEEVCVICSVDQTIPRDRQGGSGGRGSITSPNSSISSGGSKAQTKATNETIIRLVDFLVAVRFKITNLNFWGNCTRQIMHELELRWERSAYMPNLTEISVMDGQEGSFLGGWTRNLLYNKSNIGRSAYLKLNPTAKVEPLRSLELHKANMAAEDWDVFLKMVDFREIHTFVVTQSTPMAQSTLVKLAEAVPEGSKLVSFLVDAPGPTWQEMTWLRLEVEKKAKGLWSS